MRIIFHHHPWVYRGLFLTVLALGGILLSGVSAGAESAGAMSAEAETTSVETAPAGTDSAILAENRPWSLMGGYAVEEGALFDGTYSFSPAWQLNLSRREERLQLRAAYLPVPNLSLQAGYDFTTEQYLAGLKYRGEMGENTAFLAKATGYRQQDVDEYFLDYQFDLEIGIHHGHLVFAGIRGEYIPEKPHDPEIYVRMDLNWDFGRNWHLRLEPLVLVEGRVDHRTTLSRKWSNGTEIGIYCKNEDLRWDGGIFVKL